MKSSSFIVCFRNVFVAIILSIVIFTSFAPSVFAVSPEDDYFGNNKIAATALQGWYSSTNGLWSNNWWQSANALESIENTYEKSNGQLYGTVISNTYSKNSSGGFINHYYDDEGWWGNAWVHAYKITGNATYLTAAKNIFTDMQGGWDSTCGGGVWWNKDRNYKNAISNELFLLLAIRLHQQTPGDSGAGSYIDWANKEWTWFNNSGMINSQNLINDGLDASCQNNGGTTWTYNQGVILSGLTDLYSETRDATYLTKAQSIASAAIATLVNGSGVLTEPCEASNSCGGDGSLFKGIFVRNLSYLNDAAPRSDYRNFLVTNAHSIWMNDRNSSNQLGLFWSGPFDSADPTLISFCSINFCTTFY
jgi:predicted alpha-1,6-mannanase (GH76 family)